MAKRRLAGPDGAQATPKPRRRPAKRPDPQLRSIIFCDYVLKDAFTGKVSLIGTFNSFAFPTYPASPASFMIFAEITGIVSRSRLSLRVVSLDNGLQTPPVDFGLLEYDKQNPSRFFTVRFNSFKLPKPGTYDVVLLADGEAIARSSLHAVLRPSAEAFHE